MVAGAARRAAVGPVHSTGALGQASCAAHSVLEPVEKFVEAASVGEAISHGGSR